MLSIDILLAIFCTFLAVIMFHTNWKTNRYVIFIALYLLISSFMLLFYHLLIYDGPKNLFLMMNSLFRPLLLLTGPFFYFAVRGLLDENYHFKGKVYLHFIPFFVSIFTLIPYFIEPLNDKLMYVEQSLGNMNFFMTSSLVSIQNSLFIQLALLYSSIYILAAIWSINMVNKKYQTYLQEDYKTQYIKNYWWFSSFSMIALLINILCFGLTLIFKYQTKLPLYGDINFFECYVFAFQIITALLPLIILLNPGLLYAYPAMRKMNPLVRKGSFQLGDNRSYTVLEVLDKTLVYENYFTQLSQRIKNYIYTEKPFLNADFDASYMSKQLSIPISHFSFCVKYMYGSTCKRVLNDYRIAYFMQEFQAAPDRDENSINVLIKQSGFTSNKDFKKNFKRSQHQSFDSWKASND